LPIPEFLPSKSTMFEADLVISEDSLKRINAYEVEHIDYPRIFQCPACKAPLDLVKGYQRGNQHVDPTFRHRSEVSAQ
jgi:uncharacterized C2H2 Zn-finger protein